jgi:Flp pilus assembly protein TadD
MRGAATWTEGIAMPKPEHLSHRRYRRALLLAMLLAGSSLSGCAGLAPTPDEIASDDRDSKLAQALRMAETVRRNGDIAAPGAFFQRAHTLAPDRVEPLLGMAAAAAHTGQLEQAATAYEMALALQPDRLEVLESLGRLQLQLRRPQQAADSLRACLRARPDDIKLQNALGVALDMAGRQAEAQVVYRAALEKAPDNASLRNNLALSLALSGALTESIALLDPLVYDPVNAARVRQNLALAYVLADREKEAAAVAKRDLSDEQVARNLAFYRSLKPLSPPVRASAVFAQVRGTTPPPTLPTAAEPPFTLSATIVAA